jgi:D-arginine dehydrogenase
MHPTRADVIVVGAGIAGAAAAFFVSQDADTLILEKESQLAYHTTGRSAALLLDNYVPALNPRSELMFGPPDAQGNRLTTGE